ncbi:hypothetical protein D1B33_04860 [Lysinibacillus yapensis]|uniref:HNH endonuclease n=1 Tax=Ureibacillus yapensis TaxID=2304605 RepID=A0A396SA69_9BACL|nr:hypothetical protein [Lysinibacillus yapensis]RHW38221.1 hypothetical protein D1B33_04860 [Lysinibacillus yapensis]
MHLYVENERIYFHDKEQNILGYTDFKEKLWADVQSVNWKISWGKTRKNGKRKGYIGTSSSKFGKYKKLHQLVMLHWYGKEAIEEAYEKDFIVEHMDNDSFNCCIDNLSFAPDNVNKAKGLTYDIERIEAIPIVAVNMYKDFDTQKFQITVGFNSPVVQKTENGFEYVNALKLVYENDFRRTLLDAQEILYEMVNNGLLDTSKLHHLNYKVEKAILTVLQEGEENASMIQRNGEWLLVFNDQTRIIKVAPDKDLYQK